MTYRTIRIAAFCAALLAAALAIHAWLASRDEQQRLQSTLAAQKKLLDAADAREHARETTLNATLAQIAKLKRTTQTPAQILRDLPKYLSLPQPVTLARPTDSPAAPPERGTDASEKPAASPPSAASSGGQGVSPDTTTRAQRATSLPPRPEFAEGGRSEAVAQAERPQRQDSHQSDDLPSAPAAQIPTADLKPLYDFVQDCRACDAQLAVAKQNAADDAAKIAALTRERDAAITAAKGGSFWRRLRRNALWFVVGAGFGAAGGYAAAKR